MVGLTRFALVTLGASFQFSGNPWSDSRGWLVTWWPEVNWGTVGRVALGWLITTGCKSALLLGLFILQNVFLLQ